MSLWKKASRSAQATDENKEEILRFLSMHPALSLNATRVTICSLNDELRATKNLCLSGSRAFPIKFAEQNVKQALYTKSK
jgi:hypothetical protein